MPVSRINYEDQNATANSMPVIMFAAWIVFSLEAHEPAACVASFAVYSLTMEACWI